MEEMIKKETITYFVAPVCSFNIFDYSSVYIQTSYLQFEAYFI